MIHGSSHILIEFPFPTKMPTLWLIRCLILSVLLHIIDGLPTVWWFIQFLLTLYLAFKTLTHGQSFLKESTSQFWIRELGWTHMSLRPTYKWPCHRCQIRPRIRFLVPPEPFDDNIQLITKISRELNGWHCISWNCLINRFN